MSAQYRPFEIVKVHCQGCGTLNHLHGYHFQTNGDSDPAAQCFICDYWFDPNWEHNVEISIELNNTEQRHEA